MAPAEASPNELISRRTISVLSIWKEGANKNECTIAYWVPAIGSDIAPDSFICSGQGSKLRVGPASNSGWDPANNYNVELIRKLNTAGVLTVRPEYDTNGRVVSRVYPVNAITGEPARIGAGRAARWLCVSEEQMRTTTPAGSQFTWKKYRINTHANTGAFMTSGTKEGCLGNSPLKPLEPSKMPTFKE